MKSTLSLRITLDKCREGVPVPWPFRRTVEAMLERTEAITIKGWFSNAPNLSLGTLEYLPAEMRLIVWKYIPMPFDGYSHISGENCPGLAVIHGPTLTGCSNQTTTFRTAPRLY